MFYICNTNDKINYYRDYIFLYQFCYWKQQTGVMIFWSCHPAPGKVLFTKGKGSLWFIIALNMI